MAGERHSGGLLIREAPSHASAAGRALGLLLSRALSSRLPTSIIGGRRALASSRLFLQQVVDGEVLLDQTRTAPQGVSGRLRREPILTWRTSLKRTENTILINIYYIKFSMNIYLYINKRIVVGATPQSRRFNALKPKHGRGETQRGASLFGRPPAMLRQQDERSGCSSAEPYPLACRYGLSVRQSPRQAGSFLSKSSMARYSLTRRRPH
jgi:hypothetical protein